MAKALVNVEVLRWAVERADLTVDSLAEKLKVNQAKIVSWLAGNDAPTFRQAEAFASAAYIPFGYLFLPAPPEEKLAIPDLRTIGDAPRRKLDVNFADLLSDVLFKRDWYRDYLDDQGADPLPFVGRFKVQDSAELVADDIRATLFGDRYHPRQSASWEEHLRTMMSYAESAGIWVMRNGVVGSNTHRPLSVEQFRGFAISDDLVPIVFVNGRDTKAAQIFTLAHELAHIWLGATGVSNIELGETGPPQARQIEFACNRIAAELLVPAGEFKDSWDQKAVAELNIERMSRHFRVSRLVVARRALDLGLMARDAFAAFYAAEQKKWKLERQDSSGGNFYLTLPIRNGERFTKTVVSNAVSGRMLLRDAALLLNTKPASVVKLGERLAA